MPDQFLHRASPFSHRIEPGELLEVHAECVLGRATLGELVPFGQELRLYAFRPEQMEFMPARREPPRKIERCEFHAAELGDHAVDAQDFHQGQIAEFTYARESVAISAE